MKNEPRTKKAMKKKKGITLLFEQEKWWNERKIWHFNFILVQNILLLQKTIARLSKTYTEHFSNRFSVPILFSFASVTRQHSERSNKAFMAVYIIAENDSTWSFCCLGGLLATFLWYYLIKFKWNQINFLFCARERYYIFSSLSHIPLACDSQLKCKFAL